VTDALTFPRCSQWARDVSLDPAGTAPQFDVLVVVEHPLPWARDVSEDPLLSEIALAAAAHAGAGRTFRVQAAVGDPEQPERRVVVFDRGRDAFAGYGRAEGSAIVSNLVPLLGELMSGPFVAPSTPEVTDVLICTHGARDRCCGSSGTRLWVEAAQRLQGVNVWRTSHTGGHRFAPTGFTMPDGGCWAHLDEEVLLGLVERTLPTSVAAAHMRGCTAFEPAVQVADQAVLAERGWDWVSYSRSGGQVDDLHVRLGFEAPSGERGVYEVLLELGRTMPVPDCGSDPSAAAKSQVELKVAQLGLLSGSEAG
jgi:hypothetical protein